MSKIAVQPVRGGRASIIRFKLTGIRANEPSQNPYYMYDRHYKKTTNFSNTLYRDGARITNCLRTMVRLFVEKGQFGEIQIALLVKTEEHSKSAIDQLAESMRFLLGGVFNNHRWDMIADSVELEGFVNPLEWEKSSHGEFKRRLERSNSIISCPNERLVFSKERPLKVNQPRRSMTFTHIHWLKGPMSACTRLF